MAVIDQHDNFSNVSWHSDNNDQPGLIGSSSSVPVFDDSEPVGTSHPEMDEDPTRIDPGLAGDILDCIVTEPRKESDGTKDAFVSYLVTTNVSRRLSTREKQAPAARAQTTSAIHSANNNVVHVPIIPETTVLRPSALHRFCLPL